MIEEEKLVRAYFSTFNSVEGIIVLNDLMNSFYRATSVSLDCDPNQALFNEGKRFVIIYILSKIETLSKKPVD